MSRTASDEDFVDGYFYSIVCHTPGCATQVGFLASPETMAVLCPNCNAVVWSRRAGPGHTLHPNITHARPTKVTTLPVVPHDDAHGEPPTLSDKQRDDARRLLDW